MPIEFENVIEAEINAETSMSVPQRFEKHLNNTNNPHGVTKEQLGVTKVSDLENDSGFLNAETDPTVPAWAKEPTKPSYTPEEVGAEPSFSKNTAFNKNFGSVEGTICEGNDSRLSDSRPANGGNADTLDGKHPSDFATAEQGAKADSALQSETDPTVFDWAKQSTKPSYTPEEVGAATEEFVMSVAGDVNGILEDMLSGRSFAEINGILEDALNGK